MMGGESGTAASAAERTPRVLTIAGSDSGGGAGIQADLKAFARCGVHGCSAITAITAQNTLTVSAVQPLPPAVVLAQARAVLADIGVDAVKIGMLANAEIAVAVAQVLDELQPGTPVVVDPVMVAESGARLLRVDAERVLVEEILPRASVVTPNLPEARVLAGGLPSGGAQAGDSERELIAGADARAEALGNADRKGEEEADRLIRAVLALGPGAVVLTGGHRARAVDLFLQSPGGQSIERIDGERHADGAAHGSGCTHSSVLAAQLALGRSPLEAARRARELAGEAIARGLRDVGEGAGPVDILDLPWMRGR